MDNVQNQRWGVDRFCADANRVTYHSSRLGQLVFIVGMDPAEWLARLNLIADLSRQHDAHSRVDGVVLLLPAAAQHNCRGANGDGV